MTKLNDFYNLLKTHDILIYGKNYTPSTFSYKSGAVWVKNEVLGYFIHEQFTQDRNAFNNHIQKMLCDGFSVNITFTGVQDV